MFYEVNRQPRTKPIEFLCVGAFSHRKGTDHLLFALDKLQHELNFQLTMVGLSPYTDFTEAMKQQTSRELWSRVSVLTQQTSAEIAAHLAKATMVLFPTRADTGPVAVKEAAVAGVPVVGSMMGGIPDYITPGKNGLLFPPGDLAAFVQGIREACAHPLFSRGLVDPTALAQVREHLSPRRMAEGFLQIYRQLRSTKERKA
jgi:glycosyltransferase involved in cell wall biosynthesis